MATATAITTSGNVKRGIDNRTVAFSQEKSATAFKPFKSYCGNALNLDKMSGAELRQSLINENLSNPEYLEDMDEDECREALQAAVFNSVLSIDTLITKKVLFGCGGPTAYLIFYCFPPDNDNKFLSISHAEFHYTGLLPYQLSNEEAEALFAFFGLDCLEN
jgi:hypothetical protein